MRHETNSRGEVVEFSDLRVCSGCGQRFERHHFTLSWQQCGCAGGHGHRVAICLRGECRAQTFDPSHDGSALQTPLEGHRAGSPGQSTG